MNEKEKGADLLRVYTDGGCLGNPGPGGWACVILDRDRPHELSGGEPATTNNRMELTAVIRALRLIGDSPSFRGRTIELYTDSQYVKNGITTWIHSWMKNGWKTASKQPVKNKELWIKLHDESSRHTIQWHWVRGHSGDTWNERCDTLVRQEMEKQ